MTLALLIAAAGDTVASDPLTAAIAGVLGTLLLGVNGAQSYQLSGIRSELHAHREAQDARMKKLEERVDHAVERLDDLEVTCTGETELPTRSRKKVTGSHSTARGRRPAGDIRESGSRRRITQPGDPR